MIQLATYYCLSVVHGLILQGRRGNAAQLANQFGQSERSVYRCLAQLRELGSPLFINNRYHYRQPWVPAPRKNLTII